MCKISLLTFTRAQHCERAKQKTTHLHKYLVALLQYEDWNKEQLQMLQSAHKSCEVPLSSLSRVPFSRRQFNPIRGIKITTNRRVARTTRSDCLVSQCVKNRTRHRSHSILLLLLRLLLALARVNIQHTAHYGHNRENYRCSPFFPPPFPHTWERFPLDNTFLWREGFCQHCRQARTPRCAGRDW